MGVWDWFLKSLIGDREATSPTGRASADRHQAGDGAVAVLDQPDPSLTDSPATPPAVEQKAEVVQRWWALDYISTTEPAEVDRPDLCTEARALENLLVANFDGHNLTLPALPHVPERVLRRLRNRQTGLADVAKDIAEDQVIAAEVIRMANSPLYRGLNKITALQPAVTRLGVNALRILMMNQSFRSATFHRKGADTDLASIVWYRSLAGATIMRGLAQFTHLDAEDAFLLGLLHDIGNIIVLRTVDEQRAVTEYSIDIETFEYLCHECHQEFGELIADAWKLPGSLQTLIADHHNYPTDDDPLRTERLLLIVTDMVAQMIGYGTPAQYDLLSTRAAQSLGLHEHPRFEGYLEQLPRELEETLLSFGPLGDHSVDNDDDAMVLANWLTALRRGRMLDHKELGRWRHARWDSSSSEACVWLDGQALPEPVRLADISEGGMRMLFREPPKSGQHIKAAEPGSQRSITGRIVNVSSTPNAEGLYAAGIEFLKDE